MNQKLIIPKIKTLVEAYQEGLLGDTTMPEDTHPTFENLERKREYYTLPMALNYQRDSFKLWEAAKNTYQDQNTKKVFMIKISADLSPEELRPMLMKYRLALQPNKHIDTWSKISRTIYKNWGSISNLLLKCDSDYLRLKQAIQKDHKRGFPYLSGPKIFNYWMFIMSTYGEVRLKNRQYIEIAPDTHVIQASIKLNVISKEESNYLSRDEISQRWRELLSGSSIDPIDVHSPLWFWSRSKFQYVV